MKTENDELGRFGFAKEVLNGSKQENDYSSEYYDQYAQETEQQESVEANTAFDLAGMKDFLLTDFYESLEENKKQKLIGTGFTNLDKNIGGLYKGVYVLRGEHGIGRTTFLHQMADQIARTDHVLYLTLLESKVELVSKSLARWIFRNNPERGITSLDIRYGIGEGSNVNEDACMYSMDVENRLTILECDNTLRTDTIGDILENYYVKFGCIPVLIIDSLDLMNQTKENAIESVILDLKYTSRAADLTIIATVPEDTKGDYADVVWQFATDRSKKDAYDPNEIPCALLTIKNRYGATKYMTTYMYHPKYDIFMPVVNQDK